MLGMLNPGWADCQFGLVPHISQISEGTLEQGACAQVWQRARSQPHVGALNGSGCDLSGAWPAVDRRATVKDLLRMKRKLTHEMLLKPRHHLEENMMELGLKTCENQEHVTNPVTMTSMTNCSNFSLGYELEDILAAPADSPEHMDTVSPVHSVIGPGLNQSPPCTDPPTVYHDLPGHLLSAAPTPAVHPGIAPGTPSLPCASPPTAVSEAQQQAGPEAPVATLFQWQVRQQLSKMKNVSAEMINSQDSDGDTLLHIAVAQGKRVLAYVLAANMALTGTLDLPERNGQTALHIAAATDQPLILSDLLEYGAQVHRRDTWGRSPLHVCVEKGHIRSLQSMLKTLKATGTDFDVDMANYNGLSPLHVAVLAHNATLREVSRLHRSSSGNERERLLQKGQVLVECVNALLHMGASCGAKDQKSGRTCLHMAAEAANTQLLDLFLKQPTTLSVVNMQTFNGNTALHIVCALHKCRGQLEAVQMLMKRGADPGARNYESELPCQLLPGGGHSERMRQVLKGRYFTCSRPQILKGRDL